MKQIVEHKKLKAWQGILMIVLLIAVLIGADYLCAQILPRLLGLKVASLMFWVIGGAIALWMLHEFVVKYIYDLSEDVLRLNRSYGKRPRHIEDIYLRQLLFIGSPEEAKTRYPDAKTVRAIRRDADFPTIALVYRTSEGEERALIQPNDELKAKLEQQVKANRGK